MAFHLSIGEHFFFAEPSEQRINFRFVRAAIARAKRKATKVREPSYSFIRRNSVTVREAGREFAKKGAFVNVNNPAVHI